MKKKLPRRTSRRVIVSVYRVYRCYGGPEEGGWYYDAYQHLDSKQVRPSRVKRTMKQLRTIYPSADLNSVRTRFDHYICREDVRGKHTTKRIPQYE